MKKFDTSKHDAQATIVNPVKVHDFPMDTYQAYESELNERCARFMHQDAGALVYRRMRVAEVFSYGCRDMKQSLEWQLGALQKSMAYKADVPNFLEPWYGLGMVACSFGIDYIWSCLVISSLIKWLVLKYGGMRLHNKTTTFFFGIILGEYCVGGFWSLMSVLLQQRTYDFYHA